MQSLFKKFMNSNFSLFPNWTLIYGAFDILLAQHKFMKTYERNRRNDNEAYT